MKKLLEAGDAMDSSYFAHANKKKIDKSIDFLRGWEKKMVSIFRLRRCEKVAVS